MAGTLVLAIVASCATRLGRQGEEGGVELEGTVNRKGPLDRRLWERSSSYLSLSALELPLARSKETRRQRSLCCQHRSMSQGTVQNDGMKDGSRRANVRYAVQEGRQAKLASFG